MKKTQYFFMKKALFLLIFLFAIIPGFAHGQNDITSKENKKINPIDSSYGKVDSVVVEYFDDVDVVNHYVIFNSKSIIIDSDNEPRKIVTNPDTIRTLINYVDVLFISGKEKSIVGRSYSSQMKYSTSDRIRVRLFSKKDNYLTHEFYLPPAYGETEYSDTFNAFEKFLRVLINY